MSGVWTCSPNAQIHLKENKNNKPVLLLCNIDILVLTSVEPWQLEIQSIRLNTASSVIILAGSESYGCQLVCLHYWRKDTTATTLIQRLPLCFLPGTGPRADRLPWSPSDPQASGEEGVTQAPFLLFHVQTQGAWQRSARCTLSPQDRAG